MKPLLAVFLLLTTAWQGHASLVLVYLGTGEVYLATDSSQRTGACAAPQLPNGLMLVSLGVGSAFEETLDMQQAAAAVSQIDAAPEQAAAAYGKAAMDSLRPLWDSRRSSIRTALERSGFEGARPALHQFCFLGTNGGKRLEIACGAVVSNEQEQLTVELQPLRTVRYDQTGELIAFGRTEGMPSAKTIVDLIQRHGPAKALKRLVAGQAVSQPGGQAPVAVVHFSTLGDFQWESGAGCAADKSFGSLRRPVTEDGTLARITR